MTTEPAGREDLAGLLNDLKRVSRKFHRPPSVQSMDNILAIESADKAHAAIIKLEQENAKLREALKQERGKTLTDVRRLLNKRIEIYRHKLETEAASDETKAEQRFALEALDVIKKGVINMRRAAETLRADGRGR